MVQAKLRCAIYTRKSSEEGLEQGFNSLHAQREACEAYVLSQVGEGWTALPEEYDDGGFSGGSMERPGLKRLLADIEAGKIDIVVVYKVDRLTRALSDFARIIEVFDKRNVSFVSVTQAFNTTSSMGRLTLNVLLSFAQFEREVIRRVFEGPDGAHPDGLVYRSARHAGGKAFVLFCENSQCVDSGAEKEPWEEPLVCLQAVSHESCPVLPNLL